MSSKKEKPEQQPHPNSEGRLTEAQRKGLEALKADVIDLEMHKSKDMTDEEHLAAINDIIQKHYGAYVAAVWYEVLHNKEFDVIPDALDDYIDAILKMEKGDISIFNDKTLIPTDKINNNLWKMLEDTSGQLKMGFNVAPTGSEDAVNILLALDFEEMDGVKISRKLTPYDKRVYGAIGALYEQGAHNTTYEQIYKQMNYGGRPSARDIERVRSSVLKMMRAIITVDNYAEVNKKYGYPEFKYYGQLLKAEVLEMKAKGAIANGVKINAYPTLLAFAKGRKQVTTVYTRLLSTPLNMTDANIQLEDYFIEEISRIKNGSRNNNKMLYTSIYEHTGINTKKQRQRAPEKIQRLLNFYKAEDFIKGYKESKDKEGKADGIIIIV